MVKLSRDENNEGSLKNNFNKGANKSIIHIQYKIILEDPDNEVNITINTMLLEGRKLMNNKNSEHCLLCKVLLTNHKQEFET